MQIQEFAKKAGSLAGEICIVPLRMHESPVSGMDTGGALVCGASEGVRCPRMGNSCLRTSETPLLPYGGREEPSDHPGGGGRDDVPGPARPPFPGQPLLGVETGDPLPCRGRGGIHCPAAKLLDGSKPQLYIWPISGGRAFQMSRVRAAVLESPVDTWLAPSPRRIVSSPISKSCSSMASCSSLERPAIEVRVC